MTALESAMRKKRQAEVEEASWLFHARNAIVHVFSTPVVEDNSVKFVVETARRRLDETPVAKKSAG